MDAKCLYCNNKANFDIEKNKIICKKCNTEIDYDKYIETMKDRVLTLADDFQNNLDRPGYWSITHYTIKTIAAESPNHQS
jgi:hypothetical protein